MRIPKQSIVMELNTSRRYITECISYTPLIVTVNTIGECLRTDINILGGNKKSSTYGTYRNINFVSLFDEIFPLIVTKHKQTSVAIYSRDNPKS
jgi:hypothetical protein